MSNILSLDTLLPAKKSSEIAEKEEFKEILTTFWERQMTELMKDILIKTKYG